jgi:5-methylcytosine-specific restriction endonuclease McrA
MLKPKSKQRPWDRIKPITQPVITRARDEFYHTSRWKKESRAFRQQYPLCAACSRDGLIVPAEVTDHVIPKNACQDPWDKKNWEPLCKKCHAKKGARDKKHFKK